MGVAKKGTKLKTIRRRVEHKELGVRHQPQSSKLQQGRAFALVPRNTPATTSVVSGMLPICGQPARILIDTHVFPPSIEDILVVRDFSNVFPDEIPHSLVN